MKLSYYLTLLLTGISLLLAPAGLLAKEQPAPKKAKKSQAEKPISAEDMKVIAHMDLLQQMEMLKDFKILHAEEKKQ